jgi:D-amino-acid oxidase
MQLKVAIVGAGVIGITNAICLLEKGFNVTVFTKDDPLKTNSDAAVATWYIPDDSRPLLQQLCLDSLLKFGELSASPDSGVQKIPMIYYFKSEDDFKQSAWAKESLMELLDITPNLPEGHIRKKDFPIAVSARVPLVDPNIYRPFMLNKFAQLGGELELKTISSLTALTNSYDIVINSAGWESKYLTNDANVYPVRGQTEVAKINESLEGMYSLNIADIDAYVVFRPQSHDCVLGTTYQINDITKEAREVDRDEIVRKVSPFFSEVSSMKTTSKVGIRCGRSDVRLESESTENDFGKRILIIHCYGHGGSGFSSSWGSANRVLEHCISYVQDFNQSCRHYF